MNCILNTDGGSRGNPGPAGCGFVLSQKGQRIKSKTGNKFLGKKTNNEAEYWGLIYGLEMAAEEGFKSVEVRMDSELIVKQLKGQYKVRDEKLVPLFAKVLVITNKFKNLNYKHVPREKNRLADGLANEAMDKGELRTKNSKLKIFNFNKISWKGANYRKHLWKVLEKIDEQDLWGNKVTKKWTAKDTLSHIVAWEWENLKALKEAQKGKTPSMYKLDEDEFNIKSVDKRKKQNSKAILAEFKEAEKRFNECYKGLQQSDIDKNPEGFSWLWDYGSDNSHDLHHAEQLRKALKL